MRLVVAEAELRVLACMHASVYDNRASLAVPAEDRTKGRSKAELKLKGEKGCGEREADSCRKRGKWPWDRATSTHADASFPTA